MTLKELGIGQKGIILSVGGSGALRQHFLDMGLIRGAEVTVVKYAPMGDPIELKIHGYELTIRLDDAEKIEVKEIKSEEKEKERRNKVKRSAHPGYGEGGKYHKKETENPLKDDETLTFALVGNQNCGKTTLFNQLTGASQHVGNFPGVTVDRKDGVQENTLRMGSKFCFVDTEEKAASCAENEANGSWTSFAAENRVNRFEIGITEEKKLKLRFYLDDLSREGGNFCSLGTWGGYQPGGYSINHTKHTFTL